MEAKLYASLYRLVFGLAHPRRTRVQFSDHWIVMVFLWSVLHDRPRTWTCDPDNWPKDLSRPLPDDSTLSRRLRTIGVQQLLERAMTAGSDLFPVPLVKLIDSKPASVGSYTHDKEAKRGRLANAKMGQGYRLHAITHGRILRHWTLLPMNEHDTVAADILLPRLEGYGYVVGDNAFDSNEQYGTAAAANHQLLAPARKCNRDVRDARRNEPERLRSLDMLHGPLHQACGKRGGFGADLYDYRQRIESGFSGLTFLGLGPALPPFVRGPRRVALWMAGKILVSLCHEARKQGLMR